MYIAITNEQNEKTSEPWFMPLPQTIVWLGNVACFKWFPGKTSKAQELPIDEPGFLPKTEFINIWAMSFVVQQAFSAILP